MLEEKIVRDVRDVDLGLIFGIGFPPFRGGLLFWADTLGAAKVVEMLKPLEPLGERFEPTPLLARNGREGPQVLSPGRRHMTATLTRQRQRGSPSLAEKRRRRRLRPHADRPGPQGRGWFRDVRSDDLAVACVRALVERTGIDPAEIEDVILGNTQQTGEQGSMPPARSP